MYEQDQQDSDQWQQHNDLLAQERLALDCLTVCHKHGLEGTADQLAPLLGVNKLWQKTKAQLHAQPRAARVA